MSSSSAVASCVGEVLQFFPDKRAINVEDCIRVTRADESFASFSFPDSRERADGCIGRELSAVQRPIG